MWTKPNRGCTESAARDDRKERRRRTGISPTYPRCRTTRLERASGARLRRCDRAAEYDATSTITRCHSTRWPPCADRCWHRGVSRSRRDGHDRHGPQRSRPRAPGPDGGRVQHNLRASRSRDRAGPQSTIYRTGFIARTAEQQGGGSNLSIVLPSGPRRRRVVYAIQEVDKSNPPQHP